MPFAFEIREMPILLSSLSYITYLLQQICGRLAFPIAQICTTYTYLDTYLTKGR